MDLKLRLNTLLEESKNKLENFQKEVRDLESRLLLLDRIKEGLILKGNDALFYVRAVTDQGVVTNKICTLNGLTYQSKVVVGLEFAYSLPEVPMSTWTAAFELVESSTKEFNKIMMKESKDASTNNT